MKKFICVIVLVAVTLGLGIAETVYSSQLYKDLNLRLIEINEDISSAAENGDFSNAAAKTDDVIALWEKNKKLALMITNHSTIRSLDEKFISLRAWIACEGYEDAKALCEVSIALTEDMIDETYPVLGNLF